MYDNKVRLMTQAEYEAWILELIEHGLTIEPVYYGGDDAIEVYDNPPPKTCPTCGRLEEPNKQRRLLGRVLIVDKGETSDVRPD